MAEGWAHALIANKLEPYSAGLTAHGLNPKAVAVMAEVGVDITGQQSQTTADLGPVEFAAVVTVCGHADEHCPVFPGAPKVIHIGFDDPPKLEKESASEEEALGHYRRVRDEIKAMVESLPERLGL